MNACFYSTGAQEWHLVSLLGDVTSPTTAVDYVSMTSDLRVLSTEKHYPVRRQHTVYTNKSLQCKGEILRDQGGNRRGRTRNYVLNAFVDSRVSNNSATKQNGSRLGRVVHSSPLNQ